MEPTVSFLRERLGRTPDVVLVLGSGLGHLADEIEDAVRVPYGEILGFPRRAQELEGHAGALVAGRLAGVEIVAMAGRFHLYEGFEASEVVKPLRALAALGATAYVATNAAGGLQEGMRPGDIMLITDHLNLTFRNPLTGPVVPGDTRFPDMSDPYDPAFRRLAVEAAARLEIPLRQGVYAALLGPSYETPAEIRMLRTLGADAVGMSTVPEVIAARAFGMRCLAFSLVTNVAAGLIPGTELSHEEVTEVANSPAVRARMGALVRAILPEIAAGA